MESDPIRYQRTIPITCRQIIEEKFNPNHIDFFLSDDEIRQLEMELKPELLAAGIKTIDDLCLYKIRLSLKKKEKHERKSKR